MSTSFTLEGLVKAARQCAKGVMWKASVAAWVHPRNIMANCLKLWRELDSGTYREGGYVAFHVHEPKKRLILSPRFRDRVVQRAMCNDGLYEDLTRDAIYDSCACLKDRGTAFAIGRLTRHLRRHFRKHGDSGWFLRLDIKSFFASIPHAGLKEMAVSKIRNPEHLALVLRLIDSFPDPGLGLGSQLSQLLAMSYLSGLDHYIKERLDVKAYIRYSDDMVLVHSERQFLLDAWGALRKEMARLGLHLNPSSTLQPLANGIPFMKFRFLITDTGKVRRIPMRSKTRRFRRKMKGMQLLPPCGRSIIWESLQGHLSHLNLGTATTPRWILHTLSFLLSRTGRTGSGESPNPCQG